MEVKTLDLTNLVFLLEKAVLKIQKESQYINQLNVFPIPDGDTGTNLKITLANSLNNTKTKTHQNTSLFEFGKVFSHELLMNARGNSGVIFSQIFIGFFSAIKENIPTIDLALLKICFQLAQERAYKTIINPVEGTMLTIIRTISEKINSFTDPNLIKVFEFVWKTSLAVLEKTPEMLPVLKEAQVVDAGGYGLCKFFEGFYLGLTNQNEETTSLQMVDVANARIHAINKIVSNNYSDTKTHNTKGFGYCCEFIIQKDFITHQDQPRKFNFNQAKLEKFLLKIGDSLAIVEDNNLVKVHVHTVFLSEAFRYGQKYGEFLTIKVDNMTHQYLTNHPDAKVTFQKPQYGKDLKIVLTCTSPKIFQYLKSHFGVVTALVHHGIQNPSVNDFVKLIQKAKSENVLLLGDLNNTYLSMKQAARLLKNEINTSIVKSTNIIEMLAALMAFDPQKNRYENEKKMNYMVKKQNWGCVFQAPKSNRNSGIEVNKDDYVALLNNKTIACSNSSIQVCEVLLNNLKNKNKIPNPTCFLFYNEESSSEDIAKLKGLIVNKFRLQYKIIIHKQKTCKYYVGLV